MLKPKPTRSRLKLYEEETISLKDNNNENDFVKVKETSIFPNYRRFVTYCASNSSSSSSSASSVDSREQIETSIPRNIKRAKRTLSEQLKLQTEKITSVAITTPFLVYFVTLAIAHNVHTQFSNFFNLRNNQHPPIPQTKNSRPDELFTNDQFYYAETWGYQCEAHEVLTEDGYILLMYRLSKKGVDPRGRKPVMLGHGLFQCSGDFIVNEEQSLAFSLIDNGYDVWLGNNRAVASYDHISLSHKDPEYWNWGLKELAIYDFTAMIDHVRETTGYSKVAYIGHSQGNAQAFIALSLCPEIANKLNCFVALAPAVFAGNLVNAYPLRLLINMSDWFYSLAFGTGEFLSIMSKAQRLAEPKAFSFFAYSMYAYLFEWWDHNWVRRRKAKYFQFTPRPVSVRLIADWITGWGRKGVCVHISDLNNHAASAELLSDQQTKLPLIVFYGTGDFLVDGEKLVRTFPGYENHGSSGIKLAREKSCEDKTLFEDNKKSSSLFPMLDLVHVERIEGYEHMDTIWAYNNHITTYPVILKHFESIQWDD